jgi:hypothetical protein
MKFAPRHSVASPDQELEHSLERFVAATYATDFMVAFDWMNEFPGDSLSPNNRALLHNAGASQLRKLLIAHVRLDRFSTGHLLQLLRSGYLDQLLTQLKAVQDAP